MLKNLAFYMFDVKHKYLIGLLLKPLTITTYAGSNGYEGKIIPSGAV